MTVRRVGIAFVLAWLVASSAAGAQEPWLGRWIGTMEREGKTVDLAFEIVERDGALGGSFTSMRQRVMEYPLDAVSVTGDSVRMELGGGSVVFEGERSGDRLTGRFTEGEGRGTFVMVRTASESIPYTVTDVRFENGDVTLAGTLHVPSGERPFPAVVFLHGAGPEVRWGANRFFADHLVRQGIAALIYDKRGTGESTGDWREADLEDLTGDALAGVRLLREQPSVDAERVGIFGHSQGGAMGPLVATRSQGGVAFVIAAAATGLSMWESEIHSLQSQVRALGTVQGASLARADSFAAQMVEVARAGGKGWDALKSAAEAARARNEPWIDLLQPPPEDFYFWRWYPAIAGYDPAEFWAQVTVPALILEAEDDLYVPVERSVPRIDAALRAAGNTDYTILVLPDTPHNFLLRPGPGEPFDWPRLAPGYADLLAAWILYRVGRP